MRKNLYLCAGLSLTAATANAALLVEDTFLSGTTPASGEYAADTALVGANPTIAGTSGAWLGNVGATDNVKSVAAGLDYSDPLYLAESGGSASFEPDGSGDGGRQGRILSSPVTSSTTGDLYMSFLMQTGTNNPNAYRAFELHDGGFNDGSDRKFQLGFQNGDFDSGGTDYGFRLFNNNSFRTTLDTNTTNVTLFVAKFSLSAVGNGDSITVWQDPDLSTGLEPAGGESFDTFDITFDRFTLAMFGETDTEVSWDEVRFGDTFADVTIPEPSSLLFLGLSSAFFFRRRRSA